MVNIAIDGTSGSGKSSISQSVATKIGFKHLNTGEFYRAFALNLIRNNLDPNSETDIEKLVKITNINVRFNEKNVQETILNGENVSSLLSEPNISENSAKISQYLTVRQKIRLIQRETAKKYNIIMEGRDIGTEILPNADVKFFITASLEERANRRYKQYLEKGVSATTYEEVLNSLKMRDYLDENRAIAPLKKADDAILVDSTNLTYDEVVNLISNIILKKIKNKGQIDNVLVS